MASKYFSLVLILFLSSKVESASLLERSYEYVMNLGKNLAPSFMTILDCLADNDPWNCAKERAGKILDNWDEEVDKQRKMWQEAADAEVTSTGRSIEEMPSKLGKEVEESLVSLADLVQHGVARAARKHHDSGGIDSITISTGGEKKKMKKKKQKPAKIHLVHPVMMPQQKQDRGFKKIQSWVIGSTHENDQIRNLAMDDQKVFGHDRNINTDSVNATPGSRSGRDMTIESGVVKSENDDDDEKNDEAKADVDENDAEMGMELNVREGRGIFSDIWAIGEETIDVVAEHAIKNDNSENGVEDRSSFEEQRGKKKKKKKAILKLLILGAVLKAKIATILQILSFKLQVKFFIIALIGLGINLARFVIDLKKKHHEQPQKVIYYEHAQHQHHYDHEEDEHHGWGPWSRSMDPPEEVDAEIDVDFHNSPFRGQVDRNTQIRPIITRLN